MKYFLILSLAFSSLPLHGQVDIDSLKKNWNNTNLPDSIRIQSINALAWEVYLFTVPDSAFYYAQLHYDFAKEKGLSKEMAVARNTQGTSFYMTGNYGKAIDYFYQSLKIKEKNKDYKGIAATHNNIGMVYDEQGDIDKAIAHYTKAIEYINKSEGEQNNSRILVATYHNIGALHLSKKDYEKALDYFNKTLDLTRNTDFQRERAYTFSNMGHIYLKLDDLKKSTSYFGKAYKIVRELGDENGIMDALLNFSGLYIAQEKYLEAIPFAREALDMAETNHATVQIQDAAKYLYQSYAGLNDFKKALSMHELYVSTRDSIKSERNREEVLRQEFKYNYEKQAAADSATFAAKQEIQDLKIAEQLTQLEAARVQRLLLYSILGLLLVLSLVIYQGYKRKKKANGIITLQKKEVEKQRDKIAEQHALLEEKSRKIVEFNNNLELLVEERTRELEKSIHQIWNYQFDLAHKIRAPFVSLVGLINLINDDRFDSEDNKEILQKLEDTSRRISVVLQDMSKELNNFDEKIKEIEDLKPETSDLTTRSS